MREGKSVSYAAVLYTGAWVTTCTVRAVTLLAGNNPCIHVSTTSWFGWLAAAFTKMGLCFSTADILFNAEFRQNKIL